MARTKYTEPRCIGPLTPERDRPLPSIEGKNGRASEISSEEDDRTSSASASNNGENGVKPADDQEWLRLTHPQLKPGAGSLRNQFLDRFGCGVVTVDNEIDEPFGKKLWRDVFVDLFPDAVRDATFYIHGQRQDRDRYETIYRFPPEQVLEFDLDEHKELIEAINCVADMTNRPKWPKRVALKTWAVYRKTALSFKGVEDYTAARKDSKSEVSKAFCAFRKAADSCSSPWYGHDDPEWRRIFRKDFQVDPGAAEYKGVDSSFDLIGAFEQDDGFDVCEEFDEDDDMDYDGDYDEGYDEDYDEDYEDEYGE